eukprot:scaffold7447_cov353-Pinguiococcus_pyrenoidosus.AAC.3
MSLPSAASEELEAAREAAVAHRPGEGEALPRRLDEQRRPPFQGDPAPPAAADSEGDEAKVPPVQPIIKLDAEQQVNQLRCMRLHGEMAVAVVTAEGRCVMFPVGESIARRERPRAPASPIIFDNGRHNSTWGLSGVGTKLALSANSHKVTVFDVPSFQRSGDERNEHVIPVAQGRDHWGNIPQLDISPDGSSIASASLDGNVRVWKIGSDRTSGTQGSGLALEPVARRSSGGRYPWHVRWIPLETVATIRDPRAQEALSNEWDIPTSPSSPSEGEGKEASAPRTSPDAGSEEGAALAPAVGSDDEGRSWSAPARDRKRKAAFEDSVSPAEARKSPEPAATGLDAAGEATAADSASVDQGEAEQTSPSEAAPRVEPDQTESAASAVPLDVFISCILTWYTPRDAVKLASLLSKAILLRVEESISSCGLQLGDPRSRIFFWNESTSPTTDRYSERAARSHVKGNELIIAVFGRVLRLLEVQQGSSVVLAGRWRLPSHRRRNV